MGDRTILEKREESPLFQKGTQGNDNEESLEKTVAELAKRHIKRIDERLQEYKQLIAQEGRYVPFPKETRKEYYRTYLDSRDFLESLTSNTDSNPEIEQLQIKFQHLENYIVRNNDGIVYQCVNRSKYKIENSHLEEEDLVQLGYSGIFSALSRYDPEKAEFSTYASHWINQKIDLGTKQATGATHIPLRKLKLYFAQLNGLELTEQELSKKDIDKISIFLTPKPLDGVRKQEDGEFSILDFYIPQDYEHEKERENKQLRWEEFKKLYFCYLPTREQDILLKRTTESLEAIGNEYGLTRERIRQIEMSATEKLQSMIGLRQTFEEQYSKSDDDWHRLIQYTNTLKKNTADRFITYLKTQDPTVLNNTTRQMYQQIREFVSDFDDTLYTKLITAKKNKDIKHPH
jgi:RNA polymerase sigma factor (sigma-70 family)